MNEQPAAPPEIQPACDCDATAKCLNSRPGDGYRYRRYGCEKCGRRWTTVEIVVPEGTTPMSIALDLGTNAGAIKRLKEEVQRVLASF